MDLILASTSPYRRRLLERLGLPFTCVAPEVDETPLRGETPQALAGRLAQAKARTVAKQFASALVVGSDQVAELGGQALGKPGNFEAACEQLRAGSGRRVNFHTGVALCCIDRDMSLLHIERFSVRFRDLDRQEIETYLRREQPYDCAGSFKAEGLGIALFESLQGDDPTGLEGLPLIALCGMLREAGLDPILG